MENFFGTAGNTIERGVFDTTPPVSSDARYTPNFIKEPVEHYHDPFGTKTCAFCLTDDRLRFSSLTDADFIREYRHKLSMLIVQVKTDLPEMRTDIQRHTRRLNSLEALSPKVQVQQAQLMEVRREVRSLRRTLDELRVQFESERRPLRELLVEWLKKWGN